MNLRTLLFAALLLLFSANSQAQTLPDFSMNLEDSVVVNSVKADKEALKAANYLFSIPYGDKSKTTTAVNTFLVKWMTGTHYTFEIDQQLLKCAGEDKGLVMLLMAAQAKYLLTYPDKENNQEDIKTNALKIVADYAADPNNNVPKNPELKKLIKARKQGKTDEYFQKS